MREKIPAALDGERVDRVVSLLTGLPRTEAAALVAAGGVRIAGRAPGARGRRVHTGQTLEIDDLPERAATGLVPDPQVEVAVVWADDQVIVVDKPAGLVVHPGAGHQRGTLVHGLLSAFPDLAALATGDASERPGIVQRLDRGTSGLLVVARTAAARDSLAAQLGERTVERRYTALVEGWVDADTGLIDAPLARSPADPIRVAVVAGGREARTRYQVRARYRSPRPATLVECRLETGRTHQIRVHMAAIGHPVVGDERYGTGGRGDGEAGRRPFLHAAVLGFDHPVSGRRLRFESPLPADLGAVLTCFSG